MALTRYVIASHSATALFPVNHQFHIGINRRQAISGTALTTQDLNQYWFSAGLVQQLVLRSSRTRRVA